jgi:predicted DNA binding CopG/RHH family protein
MKTKTARKTRSITANMPAELSKAVRARAASLGLPISTYVQILIRKDYLRAKAAV